MFIKLSISPLFFGAFACIMFSLCMRAFDWPMLGSMPGDFLWQSPDKQTVIYLPMTTCLFISLLLGLLSKLSNGSNLDS